jgi:hypothetical protein
MPDPVKNKVEKAPRARALYEALQKEKAVLLAELKPFRDFYEAHVSDKRFTEAKARIKKINALLFPIDNELAALARAGGARGIKVEAGNYTDKDVV